MESYKKAVKTRMQFEVILGVILIPLAVVTMIHLFRVEPVIQGSDLKDFIGGFFNGVRAPLVAAVSVFLFVFGYRDHKAYKDEKKLKELYIEEHDERTIAIGQKASKRAYFITMYSLLVATIIVSWFNAPISITLLAVWTYMAVVAIITKNVYNSKM